MPLNRGLKAEFGVSTASKRRKTRASFAGPPNSSVEPAESSVWPANLERIPSWELDQVHTAETTTEQRRFFQIF